jgi:hypothetical protein
MKRLVFCVVIILTSCEFNEEQKEEQIQEVVIESSLEVKPVPPIPEIDSSLLVFDAKSKLVWMKEDFASLKNRYLRNWDEVFLFEKEMNARNYGGYSDWRVPTIAEYRTINSSESDRKLYRELFIEKDSTNVWGEGAYAFWSSTTPNKNTASYISFIDGFATSGSRGKQKASGPWEGIDFAMSARLVRSSKLEF